jgi:hypothetical protein
VSDGTFQIVPTTQDGRARVGSINRDTDALHSWPIHKPVTMHRTRMMQQLVAGTALPIHGMHCLFLTTHPTDVGYHNTDQLYSTQRERERERESERERERARERERERERDVSYSFVRIR